MVLKIKNKLLKGGSSPNVLEKRQLFTFGAENSDITIVNEGFAITGFIQVLAYGLGQNETDMGFEVTRSMKNQSGADRTVGFEIKNQTQNVVLESGSIVLSNGELSTVTKFYPLEKITNGDFVRFTISNQGIGTASGSVVFAQMSFKVKSIFLREDGE